MLGVIGGGLLGGLIGAGLGYLAGMSFSFSISIMNLVAIETVNDRVVYSTIVGSTTVAITGTQVITIASTIEKIHLLNN